MISINYFPNKRFYFFPLIYHFLKQIKNENKEKIILNILTVKKNSDYFKPYESNSDNIKINVIIFNDGFNYTEKLTHVLNLDYEYSVKLDEDCFINNHVWDYMIENVSVLDNDENLLFAPLLSTTIPSCDEFINGFFDDNEISEIHNLFLNQEMPNGLFNVDYSPLNSHTIHSKKWNYHEYYKGLELLPTDTKGMHPVRISYNAQMKINEFILNKYKLLLNKNDYSFFEINSPYFTNNTFFIKTSTWKKVYYDFGGVYDEIPISNYKRINNKKFIFVKNSFSVHTMFNTVYGNNNRWNIGGENGEQDEIDFYNKLSEKILNK